ncbi:4-hydroxybenzoate octaprenyltransferase [Nitrospira japonica]|nr:4-hydroxybenzoate octaprenyltransferase [Nitrospira japonica]
MAPVTDSPPQTLAENRGARFSWSAAARLIRLHSQTGTWLLLLPTLWSLVLAARGVPALGLIVTFSAGSFLMRSAGVVLNDLADRSVDREVARTRTRPLASGELSFYHACGLAALLLGAALALVLTLNQLTLLLSPIAMVLAGLYPFAKRVVHVPQAILGIAFGWGTIMAWAASRGTIESPAWLLFGATICWAVGYDTIYALQDREDDRRIGVKSSALFFDRWTWLAVAAAFGGMLTFLVLAGLETGIGWIYYAALAIAAVLFAKQTVELAGSVSAARAFTLFHRHVWIGSGILAGMLAGFLWQ